jgi:hypothetical protein
MIATVQENTSTGQVCWDIQPEEKEVQPIDMEALPFVTYFPIIHSI